VVRTRLTPPDSPAVPLHPSLPRQPRAHLLQVPDSVAHQGSGHTLSSACSAEERPLRMDGATRRRTGGARARRYRQAELQNGRWAMMGAAGILVEDLLGHLGAGGPAAQTPWCAAHACANSGSPMPVGSCAVRSGRRGAQI